MRCTAGMEAVVGEGRGMGRRALLELGLVVVVRKMVAMALVRTVERRSWVCKRQDRA